MTKVTYKDIAKDFIRKISMNEYTKNMKLPSEAQISIKYGVSRIVSSRVYQFLIKVGAVYSVPKKGYFVAEHFNGLIKPIGYAYGADKVETIKKDFPEPESFKENNIVIKYKTFERNYFRRNELLIVSQLFLDQNIHFKADRSLIDHLVKEGLVISSAILLKFEEFEAFGQKTNLVSTKILFGKDRILAAERYVVKPSEFNFSKQEFVL